MDNTFEIKFGILKIGEAKIVLDPKSEDYLFNGKTPRDIPELFYENLYKGFEGDLNVQIKEGVTVEQIEEHINTTKEIIVNLTSLRDSHRVHFLLSKRDNLLSERASDTHEDISRIISTQKTTLNRILLKLIDVRDSIRDNGTSEGISTESTEDVEITTIPFSSAGRATFKMNKKEALMLLFLLEETGLIDFGYRMQKVKFVDNNFNYTEMRPNHRDFNKPLPMKGTGKIFSNLVSPGEIEVNNSDLKVLLQKLTDTIHQYEFVVKTYKS